MKNIFRVESGGIVSPEFMKLINRVNELESKLENCECCNKFKPDDIVKFIYNNDLYRGKILSKELTSDCYCIHCNGMSFMVPEKQICQQYGK